MAEDSGADDGGGGIPVRRCAAAPGDRCRAASPPSIPVALHFLHSLLAAFTPTPLIVFPAPRLELLIVSGRHRQTTPSLTLSHRLNPPTVEIDHSPSPDRSRLI